VPNFSHIVAPLHKLLKKDTAYEWTVDQEQSFQTLRGKLISPPILKYPDFNQCFILTMEASGEGLGAVLSQGEIGKDLPVAFSSRTLNRAKKVMALRKRNSWPSCGACGILDPTYMVESLWC
jgi:hypothetical protein